MEISVSVSIMAHPSRKKYIGYLFAKLGRVVPVAWDRGLGRWDTGRRAWELHDPEASHHLVLQDDVLLSRDLLAALPVVVAGAPLQPISLFACNKRPWNPLIDKCRQEAEKVRWLILQRLNWGPAILLPQEDIAPMLAWVEGNCHMPNYDVRIAYWYLTWGRPIWYTMPSLVDHRTEGHSLVWPLPNQNGRQARWFIGKEACGTDLNWKSRAIQEALPLEDYLRLTETLNEKCRRAKGRQVR